VTVKTSTANTAEKESFVIFLHTTDKQYEIKLCVGVFAVTTARHSHSVSVHILVINVTAGNKSLPCGVVSPSSGASP
ncbi:hypothetical protein L9F63_024582, partial [Diploptera punctata]